MKILVLSSNRKRSSILATSAWGKPRCAEIARRHREEPGTKIAIAYTDGMGGIGNWRSLTKREKQLLEVQ